MKPGFACELAGFDLSEADGFVFIRFFLRAKYMQSGKIHMYSQCIRRATRISNPRVGLIHAGFIYALTIRRNRVRDQRSDFVAAVKKPSSCRG